MEYPLDQRPPFPEKIAYRIGEVSAITGIEPYVLRFWESEFPLLRPRRTESGQRLYRKKDIERLQLIKHLLHVRKFTIAGARLYLKDQYHHDQERAAPPLTAELMAEIRQTLTEIREMLKTPLP